jgi:hypothetical protein
MALFWAVLFLAAAVALWQRRRNLRWLPPVTLAGYASYHLILQLFFAASPLALQGWGLALIVYALVSAALVWTIYRPAALYYWRDRVEVDKRDETEPMRIPDERSENRAVTRAKG